MDIVEPSLPLSAGDMERLIDLAGQVFDEVKPDAIQWRLSRMPEVTLFVAVDDDRWVGFKAGYAATPGRYYSWLGGVDPAYRNRGIAGALMQAQHDWVAASQFEIVETHVRQANDAMVAINMKHGMRVTGFFMKSDGPNFMMQREF